MAINIDGVIAYMNSLMAKRVRYSMTGSRTGADGTADCSGAIYKSLIENGASKASWVLNTDSMHSWLESNGFVLVAQNTEWNMERGDIIIFGLRNYSGGAAGHIVIAIDGTNVIHCNYGANGVSVNNENTLPYYMGFYVYRLKGVQKPGSIVDPTPKFVRVKKSAKAYGRSSQQRLIPTVARGMAFGVLQAVKVGYDTRISHEYLIECQGKREWVISTDVEKVDKCDPQVIILKKTATHYSKSSQKRPIDSKAKGKKYTVLEVMPINEANSKWQYLIKPQGAKQNEWVLEQDIVPA